MRCIPKQIEALLLCAYYLVVVASRVSLNLFFLITS